MKTTLDLPDDLVREIKLKAVREDRKLKDLVEDLLRTALAGAKVPEIRNRVQLPLIYSTRQARPDEDSPERIAEILLQEEVDRFLGR
jgi:hypothetical protein